MPSRPSDLIRGAIAGATTAAGSWFYIEHAGGLYRISRAELIEALAAGLAKLAGATFTGDVYITSRGLTVSRTDNGAGVVIQATTGSRYIRLGVNVAVPRWDFGSDNSPEAVGNEGSNFFINRWGNAGEFLSSVLMIYRATGLAAFGHGVCFSGIGTTANAANAYLDPGASNTLLRSTSSQEYKTDIEPLESWRADAVIDQAVPIWYRSLAPADNPEWSWYGLTAEQMAEIEPRLVHWGYRPSDYEEMPTYEVVEGQQRQVGVDRRLKEGAVKVPDGVAYERLTVMLLDVLRREKAKVAALQEAFDVLSARVEALEP